MEVRQVAGAVPSSKPAGVDSDRNATAPQEAGDMFSLLLQSVQPVVKPEAATQDVVSVLEHKATLLSDLGDALAVVPDAVSSAAMGAEDAAQLAALHVDSLLGQRQELDTASAALVSEAVQPAAGNERWNGVPAQLPTAVGQTVSIVASGVQNSSPASAAGAAVLVAASEASGTTEAVLDAAVSLESETVRAEGRVALDSHWQQREAETPLPAPVQRLMGQIEQWVASSMGVRKPEERLAPSGGESADTAWSQQDTGSGTRLTENAVREAQQAEQASPEPGREAAAEDMRFWLQGKQQRAEVLIDRHGQTVRVQVSVSGNEAHVTLRSDQAQTREMLDAGLAQLREMLQQQGLELAGVTVQSEAQGQAGKRDGAAAGPWQGRERAQHATVQVPEVATAARARTSAHALDLYA